MTNPNDVQAITTNSTGTFNMIIPSRLIFGPRILFVFMALLLGLSPSRTLHAQVAGAIEVYPTVSSIEFPSTRQFSAYVPISPNTIVWKVNGMVGGDSTVGTISPTGLYTTPAAAPANNVVIVSATSTAYPNSIGNATLTITRKYPWLWGVSPSPLQVGSYQVSFNGSNFAPDSQALANGQPVQTTYSSPTKLVVKGMAAEAGTINFAVLQPGNGAVTGNIVAVQVAAVPIKVVVSPTSSSVQLGNSQGFTATVTGTANLAVTWSVNGVVGGSMTDGLISAAGLYSAPASMPVSSTVTIRATSVASPASFAQATVTLVPIINISVSPQSASVQIGKNQQFTPTVTGSPNTSVTWSVNGINGGSATVGTINSAGLYTSPASMPASSTVTVRATSVANPTAFVQAAVTLLPPPPPVSVSVSPNSASVQLGTSQNFTATVTGNANTAVTWSVNSTVGGTPIVGFITPAGVYTAPNVPPAGAITVRATSVAVPSAYAQVPITLLAPPPQQVWLTGARFLEQSSFGPSPAELAKIQQMGIQAYLDEQFNLPESPIFTPADNSMSALRSWALYNYTTAPDQLRQRVAYALSQIIVTSGNKLIYPDEILPWMRLLSKHAFGNYRNLLLEVSVSPSMGKFLDLANSVKPGLAGGSNENYARELMQLFTIGLWQLNQNGSQTLDQNGHPITTYNQATVAQVALALTGWTYKGPNANGLNWENFSAPMEPRQQYHDTSAKTFLGSNIPAGQTVQQDLTSLIDCLMAHPNISPFIATRLIRSLVTSNPSGAFIQRIADVFDNNGQGVKGDLKAVVTAILLDPEARQDSPTATQGRLKEPVMQIAGLLRALNGQFSSSQQLTYLFDYMAQPILAPNSVFSWFSPLFHIPKSPLFGPEFQIYSPTEATLRGNFIYQMLTYPGGDMVIDLTPFQAYGNDMPGLVEAANQALLYGRMPAAMKQIIITAATPGYDAPTRIATALYLTALSGQYAVQH